MFNQILTEKLNEDSEVLDRMSEINQLFPQARKTGLDQLQKMQSHAWLQLGQLPLLLPDSLDHNDSAKMESMMRRMMTLAKSLVIYSINSLNVIRAVGMT